jgi:hypothetical protein
MKSFTQALLLAGLALISHVAAAPFKSASHMEMERGTAYATLQNAAGTKTKTYSSLNTCCESSFGFPRLCHKAEIICKKHLGPMLTCLPQPVDLTADFPLGMSTSVMSAASTSGSGGNCVLYPYVFHLQP